VYSVVLLAAMTAGGQAADHHGCFACGGCYGACYGNFGVDSYNCYGGSQWAGYGCGWSGHHGGYGCYGGYTGCGGYGCAGGYWGGYGCSCSGYPWDWSSAGCNGCWGGYSGVISPYFVQPPPAPPTTKPSETIPPPSKPGETIPPPSKPGETPKPPEAVAPNRARLIVDVPPDAKLYIDDTAMKTTAEHRTYQTPDLEPGQTYYYEVRVELQRDGKPVSETRRVLVRAGQEIHADFTDMGTTATAQAK